MASAFSPFALKGDGTPFKSPSRRSQGLDQAALDQLKRHAAYKIERAREAPGGENGNAHTPIIALDRESARRVSKANEKLGEFVHSLANEPSIGLHHVCNHVRKSVPSYVAWQNALDVTTKHVDDLSYDLDVTVGAVHDLALLDNFKDLKDLIVECTKQADVIIQSQKSRSKSGTSSPFVSPFTSPYSSAKTISRIPESDGAPHGMDAQVDHPARADSLSGGFAFKTF